MSGVRILKLALWVVYILLVYWNMSIGEYMIHSYLMHQPWHAHITHHKHVNADMSLLGKTAENETGIDMDLTDSVAITLYSILTLTVISELYYRYIVCPLTAHTTIGFRRRLVLYICVSIAIAVFYSVAWKYYHYAVHDLHNEEPTLGVYGR